MKALTKEIAGGFSVKSGRFVEKKLQHMDYKKVWYLIVYIALDGEDFFFYDKFGRFNKCSMKRHDVFCASTKMQILKVGNKQY